MGPIDVIADRPVGVLDTDLHRACIGALSISREACRNFALSYSWENSNGSSSIISVSCRPTAQSDRSIGCRVRPLWVREQAR